MFQIHLTLEGWGGGVGLWRMVVQTNSIQSAKICPNLHLGDRGWGGVVVVVVQTNSTKSGKICPNLHFGGVGRGMGVLVVQTNIPEILEWGHSRNVEHKFCHANAILWKPLHRSSLSHYVCGD